MKATIYVKCPGNRTLQKVIDFEIKGPFYTGNVITFLAGMTGEVLQILSKDRSCFEVRVRPSDYTRCRDEFGFEPIM